MANYVGHYIAQYVSRLVILFVDKGGCIYYVVVTYTDGGAKHFFGAVRGGANLFFCPPDVVFISDDHVINATSLIQLLL